MTLLKPAKGLLFCFVISFLLASISQAGQRLDDRTWDLIRSHSKKQTMQSMMFVLPGQTAENASYLRVSAIPMPPYQLDFFQKNIHYTKKDFSLKKDGMTAQSFIEKAMFDEMTLCPGSEWSVLTTAKDFVVVEARLQQCSYGAPDRREILKYFLSDERLFLLNYTVLENAMVGLKDSIWKEKKSRWMSFLSMISNNSAFASCFLEQQLTGNANCIGEPAQKEARSN